MTPFVHVMVAILRDPAGRVLIARRPEGKVQAGRWEFPGGKLEPREAPEACLRRELYEELGIVAGPLRRLIEIRHAYPAFSVRLDVREVAHFGGDVVAREGQALRWRFPDELPGEDVLEADRPIIQALRLPEHCLVTPDPAHIPRDLFLAALDASLAEGVRLVQLRAPTLPRAEYLSMAKDVLPVCRHHGARLLLNAAPDTLDETDADGIHLSARNLSAARARPVSPDKWLSAACHSLAELQRAQSIGADFVLVSPVAATASHPGLMPLGWSGFAKLAREAALPAYALGGMTMDDLEKARNAGGQGIAAIRALWRG